MKTAEARLLRAVIILEIGVELIWRKTDNRVKQGFLLADLHLYVEDTYGLDSDDINELMRGAVNRHMQPTNWNLN